MVGILEECARVIGVSVQIGLVVGFLDEIIKVFFAEE